MKKITLEDFKKRDYDKTGISNYKLVDGVCVKCGESFQYSNVKKFLRNRNEEKKQLWDTCQKCWYTIKTKESEEWIENNRSAQKIAQNKPEQKKKNAEGVSRSWTNKRRKRASKILKSRWKNDPDFAESALKNLSWTGESGEKFNQIMSRSIGSGGLKGEYIGVFYDSALELSFLMWCEEENKKVKRYDLDPIEYYDENNKLRLYYPDFILNTDTIVEIKGKGLYYRKNFQRNIRKIQKLRELDQKTLILFDDDEIIRRNYSRARKYHHENQKKNKN